MLSLTCSLVSKGRPFCLCHLSSSHSGSIAFFRPPSSCFCLSLFSRRSNCLFIFTLLYSLLRFRWPTVDLDSVFRASESQSGRRFEVHCRTDAFRTCNASSDKRRLGIRLSSTAYHTGPPLAWLGYLGLRPKRRDSGASRPQLRITKEGDVDLRTLLVQGA